VDDFDLSPDGKRVAISIHGEIFTVPLDKGRIVQITDGPPRDHNVVYDPEGKRIAFVSDRTGEEQVYVVNADGTGLKKITDTPTRKYEIDWSPDGKKMTVVGRDHSLRLYDIEAGTGRLLRKPEIRNPRNVLWTADGKWIIYREYNRDFWADIYFISAEDEKAEPRRVTERLPLHEYDVHATKEKLFFLAQYNEDWDTVLCCLDLAKQEVDPDDPEADEKKRKLKEEKEKEKKEEGKKEEEKGEEKEEEEEKEEAKEEKKEEKKLPEVKIDFEGMEKRVKEMLKVTGEMQDLVVSKDGKGIVVVVEEPRGKDTLKILYSVQDGGKKIKELSARSELGDLRFSPDGKKIYFTSGGSLVSMPAGGGGVSRVSFKVRVKIDRAAEYSQIFHECWRTMKYHFYDPDFHGVDWEAIRDKYAAVLPSVTEKTALSSVVNRMLGELKASHLGFRAKLDSNPLEYYTYHPGFALVPDAASGLYRVGHIIRKGPADHEWVDVKEGDYVLSIDGKELKVPANYWEILNHPLNTRVEVTVSSDPEGGGKRTSTINLATYNSLYSTQYREWVRRNREKVDELSNGRLAYLHIPSMNRSWLEVFKRELIEYRLKEGLVLDVRNNGGGNIDQQLLDVLERRIFGTWVPRDSVHGWRPWNGFFGPKIVMVNEKSFSDAEVFPQGFRDLGLGKIVGVPTGGGVIATGSYTLIDGSTIRTPGQGVYTAKEGLNLENFGVRPDILVPPAATPSLPPRWTSCSSSWSRGASRTAGSLSLICRAGRCMKVPLVSVRKCIGIGIGASRVKIVSAGDDLREHDVALRDHLGNPRGTLEEMLRGMPLERVAGLAITGREGASLAGGRKIYESEAVEEGLRILGLKADVVVSLGGESFVVYPIAPDGTVLDYVAGNRCAAGTVEFFKQQLGRMGLSIEDAVAAAEGGKVVPLAKRCSVHCKSDCTHALNKKKCSVADIVRTLCHNMAEKVAGLTRSAGIGRGRLVVIGGASVNPLIIEDIKQFLPDFEVTVPPEGPYFEALGAASIARRRSLDVPATWA
ncbi:MAG: S41 family peptidase, partial [Planctomycetota bacterium]